MLVGSEDASAGGTGPALFRGHRRKLLALFLWLVLLGGYQLYVRRSGLLPSEAGHGLIRVMATGTAGTLLYVALFAVRPLILFPASALAAAAGFVFGPALGIALTVVRSNLSASIAYFIGRYLGRDVLEPEAPRETAGRMEGYAEWLRGNVFETVLAVQFVYLPFDLVNYPAGSLRVGWGSFGPATFLGSLPGITSFVLLGSSVSMDMETGAMGFNPRSLLT